ncbi:MAG: hypothetical protein FWF50_07810 [Defluviitaleaceae bacterium]|nr:hypothetical protein [Defluviitaleaceae bacterium]
MIDTLLEFRESLINIVKRFEAIFLFIFKFLCGFIIYSQINSIGFSAEIFHFITNSNVTFLYLLFMSLLFVILPLNASYLFMILNVVIQVSLRLEVALLVFFGLLFMFLFYSSFSRKENILVILSIFALHFGFPYFLPIFAGMYFGVTAIIPIAIGLFIHLYSPLIMNMVRQGGIIPADVGILEIGLDEILEAFENIQQNITGETYLVQNWVTTSVLVFIVFIFVYVCRKLSINYAKEIAIGFGTILNIFVFIVANIVGALSFGIFGIIFGSIFSALLILVIKFFDVALDYKKAENVEFQDEDYYYYVKLIPKRKSVLAVRQSLQSEPPAESIITEEDEEEGFEERYLRNRSPNQRGSKR